eukprot:TRINITY_DN95630_c0_g1_i1.p1 TRINITY_DN95630_c0_g1~~TRINITY_DN95630_c0_g1_i1.p1  ORF type:complete len:352 (-),score=102.18 TRINITY_DN95630_c0_g1_i1:2-1057(-)
MKNARAMLDALMGPGRDAITSEARSTQWREKTMCRSFLIGYCPCDRRVLGGQQGIEVCDKVHSEPVRAAFLEHADSKDGSDFHRSCIKDSLEDIDYVLRARNAYGEIAIEEEKRSVARQPKMLFMADEDGAKLRSLRRERTSAMDKAKAIEKSDVEKDNLLREQLLLEAEKLDEEILVFEKDAFKKAMERKGPKLCSTCGEVYPGPEGEAAHQNEKIHKVYEKLLARHDELKAKGKERSRKEGSRRERSRSRRGRRNSEKDEKRDRRNKDKKEDKKDDRRDERKDDRKDDRKDKKEKKEEKNREKDKKDAKAEKPSAAEATASDAAASGTKPASAAAAKGQADSLEDMWGS